MTEYSNATIADALDAIEDQCRPSFGCMPDLHSDLLIGYLAQIRLAITLPEFPSMSVNDWEARYNTSDVMPRRTNGLTEDPTYREAYLTATDVACPLCLAARDTDCHTASGTRATKSHQGRIYARMRAFQDPELCSACGLPDNCGDCDHADPRGIKRVFSSLLLKDDDPTLDDILDADDRRVLAARQQVLDAAERVRQERLAVAMLTAYTADEVIEF